MSQEQLNRVMPEPLEVLGALQETEKRTFETLPAERQNEATAVAAGVTLDTTDKLLQYTEQARNAISAVSTEMIGDRKLGEVDHIKELLTDFTSIERELDVKSVHKQQGKVKGFLSSIPWLGRKFDQLRAFLERYEKISAKIDKKQEEIRELEFARVAAKQKLMQLHEVLLQNFRRFEVAIAAGELVLAREQETFAKMWAELDKSADIVAKQALKARREKILQLNNRLMRLQNVRVHTIMDLEVINLAIKNEESLRATLYELREVTIPQIRKAVAIALVLYDQNAAADVAGGVQALSEALTSANLEALDMAVDKVHQSNIAAAKEADGIVRAFDRLTKIVQKTTTLMKENEKLNEEARVKIREAEQRFKTDLDADLEEAAKP